MAAPSRTLGRVEELDSVTLTFRAPPPRERVVHYLRGLAGVRALIFLLLALAPGVTFTALGANAPFTAWTFGVGSGLFVFGVAAGAFSALVFPPPDRTVTLSADTVRETVRGATIERGWRWVVDAHETDDRFVFRVRAEAMKSFRVNNPAPTVLHVRKQSELPEIIAFLRYLLGGQRSSGL
jgi:hypothetical protein